MACPGLFETDTKTGTAMILLLLSRKVLPSTSTAVMASMCEPLNYEGFQIQY